MQVNSTASDPQQLISELLAKSRAKEKLQQSDFLKLMSTQLQHQDPLNPLNDQDFIGQITQFNILDQVTAFNDALLKMQAFGATNLIGKHVEGFLDSGTHVEGDVVEVILDGDGAVLVLDDGSHLPLDGVLRVLPTDGETTE